MAWDRKLIHTLRPRATVKLRNRTKRPKSVLVALLLGLAQTGDLPLGQRPDWKAFSEKLAQAKTLSARWEETWNRDMGGEGRVQRLIFRFQKPDSLFLEKEGVVRRIWNGTAGLELDLRKKTFHRMKERPNFNRAYFLGIEGVGTEFEPGLQKLSVLESSARFAGVDCIRLHHKLFWAHEPEYDWFFSRSTGMLVGFKETHSYQIIGSATTLINRLDLNVSFDPQTFSIEPSAGFTEAPPTAKL